MYMKPIQITFDETLLAELDATEEVRREGRSAILRKAVAEYLQQRRRQTVAEGYRRAYGQEAAPGGEFEGWEDQGQWPESI